MKNIIKKSLLIMMFIIGVTISNNINAQPVPPGPGSNGGTSTPMGGSAPLDGGLGLLIALGIGFGAKKMYTLKSEKKAE